MTDDLSEVTSSETVTRFELLEGIGEPEWTLERMARATPVDEVTTIVGDATSVDAQLLTSPEPFALPVEGDATDDFDNPRINATALPATVGKIFFVNTEGEDKFCSGATVNSSTKNLVYTAAHCVYNARAENGPLGPHTNIRFVPAYKDDVLPFGAWQADAYALDERYYTTPFLLPNIEYDAAFLIMKQSGGENLVDVVGGNGLATGNSRTEFTRAWGYPVDPPYDVSSLVKKPALCSINSQPSDAPVAGWMALTCAMTGGASGGPWLRSMSGKNVGYIVAITQGRDGSSIKILGNPINELTKALYEFVEDATP